MFASRQRNKVRTSVGNRFERMAKRSKGRKKRVEGEKNEREVVAEKRSCAVRNGTVDRYGVIQIGCDRRNPRFAIINSHLARSSPAYDSRSMAANARGGFIRFYAEPRSARVAVGNDDIAWNLGSSWICLSRRMAED